MSGFLRYGSCITACATRTDPLFAPMSLPPGLACARSGSRCGRSCARSWPRQLPRPRIQGLPAPRVRPHRLRPAVPAGLLRPEPIPPSRKSQKIPYLLRESKVRRGLKGSENGWQNQKRLAVRLAEIESLRVTQPESILFDRIEPIEPLREFRQPARLQARAGSHLVRTRSPHVRGKHTATGKLLASCRPSRVGAPPGRGRTDCLSRGSRAPAGRSPRARGGLTS